MYVKNCIVALACKQRQSCIIMCKYLWLSYKISHSIENNIFSAILRKGQNYTVKVCWRKKNVMQLKSTEKEGDVFIFRQK